MVQKYSIFAAIQRNDVMRNAYLINLVRVLCGLPVSGDSTDRAGSRLCTRCYKERSCPILVSNCTMTWHRWKISLGPYNCHICHKAKKSLDFLSSLEAHRCSETKHRVCTEPFYLQCRVSTLNSVEWNSGMDYWNSGILHRTYLIIQHVLYSEQWALHCVLCMHCWLDGWLATLVMHCMNFELWPRPGYLQHWSSSCQLIK